MAQTKVQKPEYVELLNRIQLGEAGAGVFLKAWAQKTQDPGLKSCLNFVAARETSHAQIFKRRIKELGYAVVGKEDPDFAERLKIARSDMPDAEKITRLKEVGQRQAKPTVRDRYEAAMDDEAVDPLTRSLLRWFADVEADSRDLIGETYARFEGKS